MSNQGFTERRSWRQQKKSGNRWVGRLTVTAICLLLIGLIVWIVLRPGYERRLRTLLVHAGSYETDFIMPPMFGDTAAMEIASVLDSLDCTETPVVQLRSTAETIRTGLASELTNALSDDDDTTMVIVRGYLLLDDKDRPAIACSDLGFAADGTKLSGLLPLDEIIQPLANLGPAKSTGGRILALDIEPLGFLPRLDQSGDAALKLLEQQLRELAGPHAERLWVLVTRGPLQSAGWDPKTQLPISTQTLLDAIRGEARGDDRLIHLDELASYMAVRYKELAIKRPPQIIVMQGGVGRINDIARIRENEIWIAVSDKVDSEEQPPTEEASDDASDEKDDAVASSGFRPLAVPVSRVAFASPQDESDSSSTSETTEDADPSTDSDPNESAESKPGDEGAQPASAEPNDDGEKETAPGAADAATVSDVSFWDLRDRLEAFDRERSLQPVAVAPHLWRKLVLRVLHAEIESLDDNAPKGRAADSLEKATRDLKLLVNEIQSSSPPEQLPIRSGDDAFSDIQEIYKSWRDAKLLPRREEVDAQVRSADALQYALTVGRTRWWGLRLYQQQAVANGGARLSISGRWSDVLRQAEQILAEQGDVEIDQSGVDGAADQVWGLVQESDDLIEAGINELMDDFARVQSQSGQAWTPIRQAYVWLRSPLPTGQRRRELKEQIEKSSVEPMSKDLLGVVDEIDFAKTSPSSTAGIAEIQRVAREQRVLGEAEPSWNEIAAGFTRGDFASSFSAALRMDPRDTELDRLKQPLLNVVAAIPREPKPWIRLSDVDGNIFESDVDLDSPDGELAVEIFPDSRQTSTFELSFEIPSQSRDDLAPFQLRWQGAGKVTPLTENSARLTIPASKDGASRGTAKLTIRDARYASRDGNRVPIRIRVQPDLSQSEPHLGKLNVSQDVRIGLPQRDRIRAAVQTVGLTKESVSGEELPAGVWLRTFASRKTSFNFSLFNDSGRGRRAKVWLLRIKDPFSRQGVDAYWPELLAGRLDQLRSQFELDEDGLVVEELLDGNQLLKGPTTVRLGAGRERTNLQWSSPGEESADGAAPAAGDGPKSDAGSDVSHGMALVVRLIDEEDEPLPGGDQLIWLIPNPRPPEDYVRIDEMRYDNGKISVSASIKDRIDGDNRPDEIPNVVNNVQLRWKPDDQWDGVRPGQADIEMPNAQMIPLRRTPGIPIKVSVNPNRRASSARLDVDGWPGAIRWYVEHKNAAVGTERQKWNTLQFASVEMKYGEQPQYTPPDEKVSDQKIHYPDFGVEFRGGGQQLQLQLNADFSVGAYAETTPPEVRLYVGESNRPVRTYWTDRSIDTELVEVKNRGQVTLLTTVTDLLFDAGPVAMVANDKVQFRAQLEVDRDQAPQESLTVTLDSSPPIVNNLVTSKNGPHIVGQQIDWTATFTDQMTEVTRVLIGPDTNGDGNPDGKPVPVTSSSGRFRKVFPLQQAGPFTVTAQVWDKVGKASLPFPLQTIAVKPKPKPPKPAMAPKSDGGGKPAAPAPPAPPKKGKIVGKIDTRSTMRGTFRLSPAPDKMVPESGEVPAGGPNPEFNFSNLPAGEYTLTFEGTVNNSRKPPMVWEGLKIDTAGGKAFNRLPMK